MKKVAFLHYNSVGSGRLLVVDICLVCCAAEDFPRVDARK